MHISRNRIPLNYSNTHSQHVYTQLDSFPIHIQIKQGLAEYIETMRTSRSIYYPVPAIASPLLHLQPTEKYIGLHRLLLSNAQLLSRHTIDREFVHFSCDARAICPYVRLQNHINICTCLSISYICVRSYHIPSIMGFSLSICVRKYPFNGLSSEQQQQPNCTNFNAIWCLRMLTFLCLI